ncbi:NmrA family NAD(P)-binding protein [Paraburkholderia megapolitana]|uniref:NmrA family NAD(P)-binding protein n=1 Tax=Paraburkholderia megapolitana TaxID=420953 RepID=UPI0038B7DE4B
MYVIFGASGNVGRASIAALRRAGKPVRAVVRHAQQGEPFAQLGCSVAFADLSDSASIAQALEGATAVQMLCPVPQGDPHPERTMRGMIDAATTALRAHPPAVLLALSDYGAQIEQGTGITMLFHYLEAQLKPLAGSRTRLILLRAAEHMHNWNRVMPVALATGQLPSLHHPLDKRFPTVAAQDVGELAAELLLEENAAAAPLRIVSVEGPRRVDAYGVASVLSDVSGRPVAARELPRDAWTATLLRGGLSDGHAQLIVDLYDAHNAGHIDIEAGVGEQRFGATELAQVFAASQQDKA